MYMICIGKICIVKILVSYSLTDKLHGSMINNFMSRLFCNVSFVLEYFIISKCLRGSNS
jgi:hypothetical protein